MGVLALGALFYMFVGIKAKSKRKIKHSKRASPKIKEKVSQIQTKKRTIQQEAVSRQDIRGIYKKQKEVLADDSEIQTHQPYIVTQTTILNNYLSTTDMDKLAENQLSEVEVLERLEQGYDDQIHTSFKRAAHKVGFINTRRQIRTGQQQVASFSDNQGHGIRIAINHRETSEIALDMVGFSGQKCQTKSQEIIEALEAEGISMEKLKMIDHGDPRGYQGIKAINRKFKRQSKKNQQRHGIQLRRIQRG